MTPLQASVIRLASTNPEMRPHLLPLIAAGREAAWENLPKGWTEESVKSMWATLTGDTKHKITKCMKEMEGKVDNTGAFCGSLASHVGYRGASDASLLKRAMVRVAHTDKAARAQILPMVTRRA